MGCKVQTYIGAGGKDLIPYGFNRVEDVVSVQRLEKTQICKLGIGGAYKSSDITSSNTTAFSSNYDKISPNNKVYSYPYAHNYQGYDDGHCTSTFYCIKDNTFVTAEKKYTVSSYDGNSVMYIFKVSDTTILYFVKTGSYGSFYVVRHRYDVATNTIKEDTFSFNVTPYSSGSSGDTTCDLIGYDENSDTLYIRFQDMGSYKKTKWYAYTFLRFVGVQFSDTVTITSKSAGGNNDYTNAPASKTEYIMQLTGENSSKALLKRGGSTYVVDMSTIVDAYNLFSGNTAIDALSDSLWTTDIIASEASYQERSRYRANTVKRIDDSHVVIFNKTALLFNSITGKLIKSVQVPIIGTGTFSQTSFRSVLSTPNNMFILMGTSSYDRITIEPNDIIVESISTPTFVNEDYVKEYIGLSNCAYKLQSYESRQKIIYLQNIIYKSDEGLTGLGEVYDAITTDAVDQYQLADIYANTPEALTVYGISANMLSTIKDDTVTEVQNEFNS